MDDFNSPNRFEEPPAPAQPPPVPQSPPPPKRPARSARPAPGRPPRGSGGSGWMWVALIVLALLCISVIVNLTQFVSGMGSMGISSGGGRQNDRLQEVVVKSAGSRNKIAIVDVRGVITGMSLDGTGDSMVDVIEDQLARAGKDKNVKAVVLNVDSPGGEVMASDDIYRHIKEFQEDHGKPVIGVMKNLAASGGYYVSAPCQWIVANELTMTGSIGVIMSGFNYRGLMDKVGVQPLTFTSGKMKDMLSSTKKPEDITDEEKKIVQDFIDETFARFKEVVSEGRAFAAKENGSGGRNLAKNWEDYADGRLLSGKQAYKHGFVDELGDFEAAVDRALAIAGISAANLIRYNRLFDLGNLFRLFGKSEQKSLKIDLGLDMPKLRSGQAYYLPPLY